jgi:hypothetical protein
MGGLKHNVLATLSLALVWLAVTWIIVNKRLKTHKRIECDKSAEHGGNLNVTVNVEMIGEMQPTAVPANSAVYLYTNQGHSHVPMDALVDERMAPLTKWAQMQIYRHQNPADCAQSRFLITEGWDGGLGSEMHVIGSHLAYAMQNNYILMWGLNTCRRFVNTAECSQGCACLYKEISNCSTDEGFHANKANWPSVNHANYNLVIPDVFRDALRSKIPSMTDEELLYWWRAQSVGFLMRLNNNTVSAVADMRKEHGLHYASGGRELPFPLPSGTVNAHIRHGDKHKEMTLVPSENYVQAFFSMIRNMPNSYSRVLFVSTDDETAINTCRELVENNQMTLVYTKLQRMEGGHDVDAWDRMNGGSQTRMVVGYFMQLFMSLESDAWIGTRGSNINRLIDELRCIWVDKCQQVYVEVGSPGGSFPGTYSW